MHDEENCCEHGDHPAPADQRFCSKECQECEEIEWDHSIDGCSGHCIVALELEDTIEFTAYWAAFGSESEGVVVEGNKRTQFEINEYGSRSGEWLYYCFDAPNEPGLWKWSGSLQTFRTFSDDYDCTYEGKWTKV